MTEPNTLSVRKLRHSVQKRAYAALMLMRGAPGATKEQQVQQFDATIQALTEALEKAKTAREIVVNRDFDAYKAKKDAVASMPDVEKVPASEEAAMADLTFDQIVAKLSATDEKPEAEKPEDTPPF